jgi:hypothetical protein
MYLADSLDHPAHTGDLPLSQAVLFSTNITGTERGKN